MKRWIAEAVLAAGFSVFGAAAIAQDAVSPNFGQTQDIQHEGDRSGGDGGCRFGPESLGAGRV